jgi:light-regulated signal transduction histidine kinase (bacteriophytochrome)
MPANESITELERRVQELQRANEALHDFTWAASHDLKEPLRGIVALTERLMRSTESRLDLSEQQILHLIRENVVRTLKLIDAMQQYVYVGEAGEQCWGNVDLDSVLRNVTWQLKELIAQNHAQVDWTNVPVLWSNETLLTHILQNLISNAVKYRSTEPPYVRIYTEQRDGQHVVSVEDNGIGIDAAYRDYIFEPFKRLQGKKNSGAGIGLAICRSAVRRLGGSIWVDARVPRGSIFRFTLPLVRKTLPPPEASARQNIA